MIKDQFKLSSTTENIIEYTDPKHIATYQNDSISISIIKDYYSHKYKYIFYSPAYYWYPQFNKTNLFHLTYGKILGSELRFIHSGGDTLLRINSSGTKNYRTPLSQSFETIQLETSDGSKFSFIRTYYTPENLNSEVSFWDKLTAGPILELIN